MSLWLILVIICIAGGIGGVVNALLSNNGFIKPVTVQVDQLTIIRPGVIGNILISGVAAGISWGLYGPFNASTLIGSPPPGTTSTPPSLTVSALIGAVLIGIAGARWLTNEVDKTLLRAAASKAASAQPAPSKGQEMALASPARVLEIAKTL